MYKELDDPGVELENYNTHKLQFVGDRNRNLNKKKEDVKWIDTLKFPKIDPLPYEV